MKVFAIIIIFFLSNSSRAQNDTTNFEARYKFIPLEMDNPIASLALGNIEYIVHGNNKSITLNAIILESNVTGVNNIISGSSNAIYDLNNNIIMFDDKPDMLYRFKSIKLSEQNYVEEILGYITTLYTTDRGDSLYISKNLPYYVNPLFLDKSSINNGVVKAKLKNLGTFLIQDYIKNLTGYKFVDLFPKHKILEMENLFFE